MSPALLAAPITDGIRNVLLKRTEQAIASDAFQNLWNTALTRAHSQAIALLRGESTNATIEGDAVYINLLPFINDALASLEDQLSELFNRTIDIPTITEQNVDQAVGLLEQQFGVDLPDDFGQIKVFESDALPAAQAAVATMDRVIYVLVALTILLAIVAFVLSTRRLRTALWLGFGAAIGLIVVRRLALRLDDAIVGSGDRRDEPGGGGRRHERRVPGSAQLHDPDARGGDRDRYRRLPRRTATMADEDAGARAPTARWCRATLGGSAGSESTRRAPRGRGGARRR